MPGFFVADGGPYRNTRAPNPKCCSDPGVLCRGCAAAALMLPAGSLYDWRASRDRAATTTNTNQETNMDANDILPELGLLDFDLDRNGGVVMNQRGKAKLCRCHDLDDAAADFAAEYAEPTEVTDNAFVGNAVARASTCDPNDLLPEPTINWADLSRSQSTRRRPAAGPGDEGVVGNAGGGDDGLLPELSIDFATGRVVAR